MAQDGWNLVWEWQFCNQAGDKNNEDKYIQIFLYSSFPFLYKGKINRSWSAHGYFAILRFSLSWTGFVVWSRGMFIGYDID